MTKTDAIYGNKDRRVWPQLSPTERMMRWHKRVVRRNEKFKKPRRMLLPLRLCEALNLTDPVVELWQSGTIFHVSSRRTLISLTQCTRF